MLSEDHRNKKGVAATAGVGLVLIVAALSGCLSSGGGPPGEAGATANKSGQFPIGFWNYVPIEKQDASAVRDWKDAGMTLAMGPEFGSGRDHERMMRRILAAAHKAHIRVILCHADATADALRAKGEERYRADLERAMKSFRGHPAVFGFFVGDEPGTNEFASFCRATRIHKELAPEWTPFGNLLPWGWGMEGRVGFPTWAEYLEEYIKRSSTPLLCYDHYAQLRTDPKGAHWGIDGFFRNLREYGEAARRHGIPFWTTVSSVGEIETRVPTEDDLQWQLNAAVAHGARGVLYYYMYLRTAHRANRLSPIDEHYERTETFARLSRVNRTFLKWHAPVVQELEFVRASHFKEVWGGWPEFDGKGPVAEVESTVSLIISEFRHRDGRSFLMIVNSSQTQAGSWQARLAGGISRATKIVAGEMYDPANWQWEKGGESSLVIRYDLAPGEMALYALE